MLPDTVYKIVLRVEIKPTYDKDIAFQQGYDIAYSQYHNLIIVLPSIGISLDTTWNDAGYTHVFIHLTKKG